MQAFARSPYFYLEFIFEFFMSSRIMMEIQNFLPL